MNQIPNVSVARAADRYQEAADLIESKAVTNGNGDLEWTAFINAALAVEIYLKSFLARKVLIATGTGMNQITQKAERGHDLFDLYQKIDPSIQSLMLTASQDLDQGIDLVSLIKNCKDYFIHARYSYERESLQCLNSDVVVLARHMKKLVRKVGETTHPKVVNP